MKRSIRFCVAGSAMVAAGMLQASADDAGPRTFPWRMPVDGAWTARAICRVEVPLQAFDRCPAFPSGLRLYTQDGALCPFFVHTPSARSTQAVVPTRSLNRSEVSGPSRYARLDLVVDRDAGGQPREHDRALIVMSGGRYFRLVEVLGSEDQRDWAAIGAGYLVSDGGSQRNHTIAYPVSTYPHVQIRVYPDARSLAEPLALERVDLARVTEETGERAERPLHLGEGRPDRDDPPGTQVVEADLGFAHVPITHLRFDVAGGDFARAVSLYGRSSATAEWRFVTSASLHRIGARESRELEVGERGFRYWRAKIRNHEDAPLSIPSVTAVRVPRHLVFEPPTAGHRCWLLTGSEQVGTPAFDLERRLEHMPVETALVAQTGAEEPNPVFSRSGFRYERLTVLVLVGAASLVVIGVIASMLRRPEAGKAA